MTESAVTKENLKSICANLSKAEIKAMIKELSEYLAEQKFEELLSSDVLHCTKCGSTKLIKYGFEHGRQRYRCKECGRTVSETTGTFFYHSRVSKDTWLKFIDCELSEMSLSEEKYYTHLSIKTLYFMRHKLYKAIDHVMEQEVLSSEVEVDSGYFKINLKGTQPENMPRMSKKRGGGSTYRGISHHKVCVAMAIDDEDHMLMQIVGLGEETFDKYLSQIDHFQEVNKVISDSRASIQQFANAIGAEAEQIVPSATGTKRYTTESGKSLGDLNELIEGFRTDTKKYKGIATRYLQLYLNFYLYRKKLRYTVKREGMAEVILKAVGGEEFVRQFDLMKQEMPISLQEAYYEFQYGIFSPDRMKDQHLN